MKTFVINLDRRQDRFGGDVMTVNFSTATIPKTTNGLGYYYYNPITNGF